MSFDRRSRQEIIISKSGELVDVMHGSSAVKIRSMILDIWSSSVRGERKNCISLAEAAPGEFIHVMSL